MTNNSNDKDDDDDDDSPVPLSELQDFMSKETFEWLINSNSNNEEDDDHDEHDATHHLFGGSNNQEDDEEDNNYVRVQTWKSSKSNPNGIGGYEEEYGDIVAAAVENDEVLETTNTALTATTTTSTTRTTNSDRNEEDSPDSSADDDDDSNNITIKYILSDSSGGHGDDIWAASRHISNQIVHETKLRQLLRIRPFAPSIGNLSLIELGAGGGLPSFAAYKSGLFAFVVCTDQPIPDRIRCLAESSKRNHDDLKSQKQRGQSSITVCPYSWGDPITDPGMKMMIPEDEVESSTRQSSSLLFDVVIGADCIYMPEHHDVLLNSIKMLLKPRSGVGLLPFSLHGNTSDESVWDIVNKAKTKGFEVEILESQQLLPQSTTMGRKRALVHTIRLSLLS